MNVVKFCGGSLRLFFVSMFFSRITSRQSNIDPSAQQPRPEGPLLTLQLHRV